MNMRAFGFWCASTMLWWLGCADDACPHADVEIKPSVSGVVVQNQVTCTGGIDAPDTCVLKFPAEAFTGTSSCHDLEIRLGKPGPQAGSFVVLLFRFKGDTVQSASAELRRESDDWREGTPAIPVEAGWIIPDTISPVPSVRNAGQFSLTFADDVVEGTYDTFGLVASRWWVVSALDVADSPSEAEDVAIDLDDRGGSDNKLGEFLASVPGHQSAVTDAVNSGIALHLLGIPRDVSLVAEAIVPLTARFGFDLDEPPNPSDNFSGAEAFRVAPETPLHKHVPGYVGGGTFVGGPGEMTVRLALSAQGTYADLPLVGSRIRVDINANAMVDGVAGGAIQTEDIESILVPALHQSFSATVGADCTGSICIPGSAGELILTTYDTNADGIVSLEELVGNPTLMMMLSPDLDLFDADGRFDMNQDGINDSLSLGFGFTAVSAEAMP